MHFSSRSFLVLILATIVLGLPCLTGCGGTKKASLTIGERLDRARKQKTPELQARELVRVARLQLQGGDSSGALKTLGEARSLIPEEGNALLLAPRALEVAALFAEMGDKTTARGVLERTVKLIGTAEDPLGKATLLAQAGGIYGTGAAGVGDAAKARETLAEAAAGAEKVDQRFRAEALAAVALGYVDAGLMDDATAMVETLEASAREVESPRARAEAFAAAANVRARSGNADAATGLLKEAADVAGGIESSENKAYALMAVAKATAAAGDAAQAAKLLGQADEAARRVPDPEAQKTAREKILAAKSKL